MGETITRLTQARDIQESLTEQAQRHGAQRKHADQSEVARALKTQNDAIRGGAATPEQPFPQFARADMVLASAEGAAITAARSVHVAADEHIALTSVGHMAIAAGRSIYASARKAFSLFVKKGLRLIAGGGKVEIQAQQNGIEIIAKQVLDLISTTDSIRLSAAKNIELKVNGTAVRLGPDGFQVLTGGKCHWYAGDHQTFGPRSRPVGVPLTEIHDARVAEHFVLPDNGSGIAMAQQRYRITLDDGQVIEGTSTEHGETSLIASKSMQIAKLVLLRDDGTACSIFHPALTRDAKARFENGEDQG
ncbi:DUF2345 domain-containing protein [Burkholderia ubonensis]